MFQKVAPVSFLGQKAETAGSLANAQKPETAGVLAFKERPDVAGSLAADNNGNGSTFNAIA